MFGKFAFAGALSLIAAAVATPASAQISPGRTLDPSVRADTSLVQEVSRKKKRSAKKRSNVSSKNYSWQSVRGSGRVHYLPNRR